MGKSQRTKGAVGEREVAAIFSEALGQKFERNIGQARDGGNDIDVGPLVIEVKRRKSLTTIMSWLDQAFNAAVKRTGGGVYTDKFAPLHPMVVARSDHRGPVVIIGLGDFITLTKSELLRRLAK